MTLETREIEIPLGLGAALLRQRSSQRLDLPQCPLSRKGQQTQGT